MMIFLRVARGLLYVACAGGYAWLGRRKQLAAPQHQVAYRYSYAIALCVLVIGVIVCFDLPLRIAGIGRNEARSTGLYDERRPMQIISLLLSLIAAGLAISVMFLRRRRGLVKNAPFMGIVLLIFFHAVRAISFHGTDELLGAGVLGPLKAGVLFEGSILLILLIHAIISGLRFRRRML